MKSRKSRTAITTGMTAVEDRANQKPDVLRELSNYLQSQWLRSYILFSALGGESDHHAMVRLGSFIDAIKEARQWQR